MQNYSLNKEQTSFNDLLDSFQYLIIIFSHDKTQIVPRIPLDIYDNFVKIQESAFYSSHITFFQSAIRIICMNEFDAFAT